MDASFWDAEDGVLRGFLIRQQALTGEQLDEFFKQRWARTGNRSRWQILQDLGLERKNSLRLRSRWRKVGPLAKLLHRELTALPEEQFKFCWGLLVDGMADPDSVRVALRDLKRIRDGGLNVNLLQVLIESGQVSAPDFLQRVRAAGQEIMVCADCQGKSWLPHFEATHTYICDGCMGQLATLAGEPDHTVAQFLGFQPLGMNELQEVVGDYVLGKLLWTDSSGDLHRQADKPDGLVKLLKLESPLGRDALKDFRHHVHDLRKVEDPHLLSPSKLGNDEDRHFLVYESVAPGQPLEGHPATLDQGQALALARDVTKGLIVLHRSRLVHGSIRPANVWVAEGDKPSALLVGAEWLQPMAEQPPDLEYQPIEIREQPRAASVKSDLYGMGALLCALLAEEIPDENPGAILDTLEPGPRTIVGMCLDAEGGYTKATELLRDLDALVSGGSVEAAPERSRERQRGKTGRRGAPDVVASTRKLATQRREGTRRAKKTSGTLVPPKTPTPGTRRVPKRQGSPMWAWVLAGGLIVAAIALLVLLKGR